MFALSEPSRDAVGLGHDIEEDPLSTWIEGLAKAFEVPPLSDAEIDRILLVARDVAHRVERKETPLATFLLGLSVAAHAAEGTSRGEALDGTIAAVEAMLPPEAGPA